MQHHRTGARSTRLRSAEQTRKRTFGTAEEGNTRVVVIAGVFLAGMTVSALWFHHGPPPAPAKPAEVSKSVPALAPRTLAILQHLDTNIEVRFYSMLDAATVPASLKDFSGRVDELLEQYQTQAGGRLKVTRIGALSDANAEAASQDGVKAFNLDKGDACFLGIVVVGKKEKVSLAQLSPDFEPALEADVTRAIEQVAEAAHPGQLAAALSPPDPEILDAVRRAIPDPKAVSLEEGTSMLRQANLMELGDAVLEMEAKIKAAEETFTNAQNKQSESDMQAARAQIQQLQAEQAERLRKLFAKSQAQIAAFQQLKAAAH